MIQYYNDVALLQLQVDCQELLNFQLLMYMPANALWGRKGHPSSSSKSISAKGQEDPGCA